jgi:hypothetical protein
MAQSRQFGGDVHHHHYYGNVNQGGIQFNGDVNGGVSGLSVSGGANHMPTGGARPASGGRSGSTGGRGGHAPVTGTPTGLQKAAYTALHTSVNGHSLAGAVEHVTGGAHVGMVDSNDNPIGHPHDEFVQHHNAARAARQAPVNNGQFNQARATRQQVTP